MSPSVYPEFCRLCSLRRLDNETCQREDHPGCESEGARLRFGESDGALTGHDALEFAGLVTSSPFNSVIIELPGTSVDLYANGFIQTSSGPSSGAGTVTVAVTVFGRP